MIHGIVKPSWAMYPPNGPLLCKEACSTPFQCCHRGRSSAASGWAILQRELSHRAGHFAQQLQAKLYASQGSSLPLEFCHHTNHSKAGLCSFRLYASRPTDVQLSETRRRGSRGVTAKAVKEEAAATAKEKSLSFPDLFHLQHTCMPTLSSSPSPQLPLGAQHSKPR